MLKKSLFIIFAWLLFLGMVSCKTGSVSQGNGSSDPGWTTALGVGAVQDGMIGKAKDDALQDAKKNVVKQALGEVLSTMSEVKDGEFVKSQIRSQSDGFIETYKILSAKMVSQYEYQVRIQAKVSKAKLRDAISKVISSKGRPRSMILIQESVPWGGGTNLGSNQTIAGTALETILIKKGFPLVDRAMIMKLVRKESRKIRLAISGNADAAKSLGALAGAEIVFIGTNDIKKGAKIMGTEMYSMQATISVRAIDVNTGEVLASEQKYGAYPHINPRSGAVAASKRAMRGLSTPLIESIISKYDPNKAQAVTLLVMGLKYRDVILFRSQLMDKIRGVKTVHRRGSAGKAAKLEVMFYGRSFQLVDRIIASKMSFHVDVDEVKPNAVYLKARRK